MNDRSTAGDIEIIDAHHHFYDEGMRHGVHHDRYLLDELQRDTGGGHHVVGTVFVECGFRWDATEGRLRAPLSEARSVAHLASEAVERGVLRGIGVVGHVDLRHGAAAAEALDAMGDAAGAMFVGIRHGTSWDADPAAPRSRTCDQPGLLGDETWLRGFREVAERELAFDAMVFHPQLPELAALAQRFPGAGIVVNHLGSPLSCGRYASNRDEVIERWRDGLRAVAAHQNTYLKLGGIGNPFMLWRDAEDFGDRPASLQRVWGDHIRWCIELFGPSRCMFESNYPVDASVGTYADLWTAFTRIVADATPDEKRQLFCETARRAYRLPF